MGREEEIRRLFWHVLEQAEVETVAAAIYLDQLERLLDDSAVDTDLLDAAAERLKVRSQLTANEWIDKHNRYRGR